MAKPIGTLGTVDTVTICGRVITNVSSLTYLYAYVNGSNCTFRKANATSGYQVPGGKQFAVIGGYGFSRSATLPDTVMLYADNDVGISTATGFTTPINFGGDVNGLLGQLVVFDNGIRAEFLNDFTVPSLKYLAVSAGISVPTDYTIIGIEF